MFSIGLGSSCNFSKSWGKTNQRRCFKACLIKGCGLRVASLIVCHMSQDILNPNSQRSIGTNGTSYTMSLLRHDSCISKYWSIDSANFEGLKGFSMNWVWHISLTHFLSSGDMRLVMTMVRKDRLSLSTLVCSQRLRPSSFGMRMSVMTTSGR